ncbi:MAG: hypothetical protein BJ554DRAFT_4635 [Olpidium bornovanus]|uniref:Uncharacterized protein n=1 Tax=Olpidium bornovanus TaxID=278681 RepID=A0A8H8DEY4_9FUNG|nr:MAG: hypothetical protein BJ554DRAFT_4635 [Olpidium bornovanus]
MRPEEPGAMTDTDVAHRTRSCNGGEGGIDKEALSPASSASSSSETRPRLEMDTKDDDTKGIAKPGAGDRGAGDLQGATTAPTSSSKVDRGKAGRLHAPQPAGQTGDRHIHMEGRHYAGNRQPHQVQLGNGSVRAVC